MIESAEEFVRLRTSDNPDEYGRAADDEASLATWRDVIDRYPDMREWVAHNKTVPIEILEILRHDPDEGVRWVVLKKRSWARAHPDDTERTWGSAMQITRSAPWKRSASWKQRSDEASESSSDPE